MKSFPSFCKLDSAQKEGLSPRELYLSLVGCPAKYLYLAKEEYTNQESYKIHPFRDLQVRHINNTVETVKAVDQYEACLKIVEDRLTSTGTLTVINAYPDVSEAYMLLWHLVAHFAHLKLLSPIKNKDASFSWVGNTKLEDQSYSATKHHSLAFGPALDEMNNYHVTNYVDIMMRFDDLNLFLITSTSDVTALLERVRVIPVKVGQFINLSEKLDVEKKKRAPKARAI